MVNNNDNYSISMTAVPLSTFFGMNLKLYVNNMLIYMTPQRLYYANNQPPLITRNIKRLSRQKQCKYNKDKLR